MILGVSREDFFRQKTLKERIWAFLFIAGVQAVVFFRISNYFYQRKRFFLFRYLAFIFFRLNFIMNGIDLPPSVALGKRPIILHPNGVVIGSTCSMGDDVVIGPGVVIASTWYGEDLGDRHARIGNKCFIGAHATILGRIDIGSNVIIGAGAVVTKSVPDGVKAYGVPARIQGKEK